MKNRILFILSFFGLLNQSLLLFASDNKQVATRARQPLPTQPNSFDRLLTTYDKLDQDTKIRTEKVLQVKKPADLADELSNPTPTQQNNPIKPLAQIEEDAKKLSAEDFHILAQSITQDKKLLEQKKSELQAQRLQEQLLLEQNPFEPTPATVVVTENKPVSSFFNQNAVKWGIFISTIAGLCVASFVWKDQMSNHMNEIKEQIIELWIKFVANLPIEKTDIAVEQPSLEVAP